MILVESVNSTWRDLAAQTLRTGLSGSKETVEFKGAADSWASFPTQPWWGKNSCRAFSWWQREVLYLFILSERLTVR